MQKQKQIARLFVILFLVLGITPAFFVSLFSTNNLISITNIAQAKDGEDDGKDDDKDEDKDDEEDDKDDDDKDDAAKEAEKRSKEAAKRKADSERKALKERADNLRKSAKIEEKLLKESDKEKEKLVKESADVIEDVYDEIIKAEERIAKAAAEGINVTAANARLAEAKEKVKTLEVLVAAGTSNREELRVIGREVKKLARFASHKDVHSARDMQKDINKLAKRITQTEGKITLLNSVGGDETKFTEMLNGYKGEFDALKNTIAAGGDGSITALSGLEALERKVKNLKDSVESAIYALGGTDELYDDSYENEIEDWAEGLEDVAEIEGGEIGSVIKALIAEQKMSGQEVGQTLQSVDQRNVILQTLFGAKLSDIEKLNTEITANKSRIEKLKQAAAAIDDPEVQLIINEQIKSLETETTKLEAFASGQENRLSVLGWFFRLF